MKYLQRIFRPFRTTATLIQRYLYRKSVRDGQVGRLKLNVTVLGSCRQDSISRVARTTVVRDGLTYPHTTKEIIQVIHYLKGRSDPPKLAFRNAQLGARLASRRRLKAAYNRSDVFVVEISSRKVFIDDVGNVYHHAMFENSINLVNSHPSRVGGLALNGRIWSYEQSDAEILTDMELIVDELGKDKVIFVTHFYTYKGKRSDLVDLVTAQAKRLGVLLFNPTQLLRQWEKGDLFVDEPNLAHYTDFGHSIVQERYRSALLELVNITSSPDFSILPLIQTPDTSPTKVQEYGHHGFGDVLLGAARMFQHARLVGRPACIDWRKFSLGQTLETPSYSFRVPEQQHTEMVFPGESLRKFDRVWKVFTNQRPEFPLDPQTKDFLRLWGLTLEKDFEERVWKHMQELDLLEKSFCAIHVRMGDEVFQNVSNSQPLVQDLADKIRSISDSEETEIVVLSDSKALLNHCKILGIKTTLSEPMHSGLEPPKDFNMDSGLLGFWVDVTTMRLSSKIFQISSYPWGSGLSLLVSEVYDIPLVKLNFPI